MADQPRINTHNAINADIYINENTLLMRNEARRETFNALNDVVNIDTRLRTIENLIKSNNLNIESALNELKYENHSCCIIIAIFMILITALLFVIFAFSLVINKAVQS
jgi:hypothetical protein